MIEIEFEIKTRGSMLVRYGKKSTVIYGELVFDPPTFYADINSIKNWNEPNENEVITEFEKEKIIEFISTNSNSTKIIFE